MAEPTNQIRMTLALQGQAQVAAGLKQTARDTAALGASSAAIDADLKQVVDRLRAMGEAAAVATQQLHRHQLEQAGLGTTADSAAQKLRREQDEINKVGDASSKAAPKIGQVEAAIRGVIAGVGIAGLIQLGQRVFAVGNEFDALRGRIDRVSDSSTQGQERFAFVRRESDRLSLSISDTAANYADFLAGTRGSGLGDARRDNIFSALNEAGKVYELTQAQINQNFEQVTRIAGKAKITLDDLGGSLGKTLPQTLDAVALGLGVTVDELRRMITDGELAGNEVLPALEAGFRQTFGTDVRTQIQGAASDVQRLKNELLLLADSTSGPVTSAVGDLSAYIAELLRYERENGAKGTLQTFFAPFVDTAIAGANAITGGNLRGIGSLARSTNSARDFVEANPFRPQLYDPTRAANDPFFAPGRPAISGPTGVTLLSYGQSPPSAADVRASEREKRDAERELAAAMREQQRIGEALTRDRERDLQQELRREEVVRDRVIATQTEAAVIAEELRTGQALTGAARDLFVLRRQAADPATAALKIELERLAALEAQVRTQKEGDQLLRAAETARDSADSAAASFLRRRQPSFDREPGQVDVDPFGRIRNVRDQLQGREDSEFQRIEDKERDARAAERKAGTDDPDAYYQKDLELAQAHAEAKKKIDRDYALAYSAVLQGQLDNAAGIFGDLANIASVFGEKGFRAYQKFKIAEAIASTISGAIGAFNRASEAYPPPAGQIAGGIAAASVLASGYLQVDKLRRLQPGGRRFGGAVSAGQPYEILEGGISEEFRDARSGRRYFIPGNSGEITPSRAANDSFGGARAAPKVTLITNNYASDLVSVRQGRVESDGRGGLTMEMIVEAARDNTEELGQVIQGRVGGRSSGTFG